MLVFLWKCDIYGMKGDGTLIKTFLMVISEALEATIALYKYINILSSNISIFNAKSGEKTCTKYIYEMDIGGFT